MTSDSLEGTAHSFVYYKQKKYSRFNKIIERKKINLYSCKNNFNKINYDQRYHTGR